MSSLILRVLEEAALEIFSFFLQHKFDLNQKTITKPCLPILNLCIYVLCIINSLYRVFMKRYEHTLYMIPIYFDFNLILVVCCFSVANCMRFHSVLFSHFALRSPLPLPTWNLACVLFANFEFCRHSPIHVYLPPVCK